MRKKVASKAVNRKEANPSRIPKRAYTFRCRMKWDSNSPFRRNEIDCKSRHCWPKGRRTRGLTRKRVTESGCIYTRKSTIASGETLSSETSRVGKIAFLARTINSRILIVESANYGSLTLSRRHRARTKRTLTVNRVSRIGP